MRTYWDNGGQPLPDGRLRFVTDLEDGTDPQFTYGRTQEEIFEKLALTNAHAQLAIARRTAPAAGPRPVAAAAAPATRPMLSADERMQLTVDLQNPAKSAEAIAKLHQDATGIDPQRQALERLADLAFEWEGEHAEFYSHAGNQHLLLRRANAKAGGKIGQITKEILTAAFHELQAEGLIFENPGSNQPSTLEVQPGENPEARTERPRGTRFATSTRSTGFRATPANAQTRTLKYTEEQIRTMPESKSRQLIEANDPDYAQACEFYYSHATA